MKLFEYKYFGVEPEKGLDFCAVRLNSVAILGTARSTEKDGGSLDTTKITALLKAIAQVDTLKQQLVDELHALQTKHDQQRS